MKRDEKNYLSRQKILESAIKEFGEQGYGLSSINTICSEGAISKGILYHYFKDKDALYLACITECFAGLTSALRERPIPKGREIKDTLQGYFETRITFFEENPYYQKIFCDAVVSPPKHLFKSIAEIKTEFDELNVSILTSLLQQVKLCEDITIDEVVEVFRFYQDFVSARYQAKSDGEMELKKYEQLCQKSISVLLYGVIEREEKSHE